jgi:hypothetical protein
MELCLLDAPSRPQLCSTRDRVFPVVLSSEGALKLVFTYCVAEQHRFKLKTFPIIQGLSGHSTAIVHEQ